MSAATATIRQVTPTPAELLPFHKIRCQQPGCDSIFTNLGNYDMHLKRRHKVSIVGGPNQDDGSKVQRIYYCPDPECVYHLNRGINGRNFKSIKNLRQHYQKVHLKTFICDRCGRTFPTFTQLDIHLKQICGQRFVCSTCGWDFETLAALLMHGKRKSHVVREHITEKRIATAESVKRKLSVGLQNTEIHSKQEGETQTELVIDIRRKNKRAHLEPKSNTKSTSKHTNDAEFSRISTKLNDKDTQTSDLNAHVCSLPSCVVTNTMQPVLNPSSHEIETQTDFVVNSNIELVDVDNHYHNIETQTEAAQITQHFHNNMLVHLDAIYHDIETQTEPSVSNQASIDKAPSGAGFLDRMLAQSSSTPSHMHTQTCDDYLLSELGLADIQTQTNWPTTERGKQIYTSTATSTAGFAHDEFLVSTETQTSFTQCLLDSTAAPAAIALNTTTTGATSNTGEESASTFVHLYNTQQTQTCQSLWNGLFGDQENDLIACFQSTYTQT